MQYHNNQHRALQQQHERRATKVYLATAGAATLSIYLTGKGLIEKSIESGVADLVGMGTAIATAMVCGGLLTTATMSLFSIAMNAARQQRKHVMLLASTAILPVLGVSTQYAVIGNAGAASLVYDMQDRADAWKIAYHQTMDDAAKAAHAKDVITPIQQDICQKAKMEVSTGRYSGARGYGQLTQSLDGLCTQTSAIAALLEQKITRTDKRQAAADMVLKRLDAIPKDQSLGDVFARQDAFRAVAQELEALIEASDAENVEKLLIAQLRNLEHSVSSAGVRSSALGDRQRAIIEDLQRKAHTVSASILGLIHGDAHDIAQHPAALRDMQEAVLAYWDKNIPQCLIALMLDLMCLWFCAMLMVSRHIPDARAAEQQDHKALSFDIE